jgi:O-antigen ligase
LVQSSFIFNSYDKSNSITLVIFIVMVIVSQLGYIPALPYWLYNISTFITIPIFLFLILVYRDVKFTINEILFLSIFIFTILLSSIVSPYEFTISGFLRALVPIIYFYLVRTLKITKVKTYYDVISFMLVASFVVALYQVLFQPIYLIEDGVWNIYAEDVFWFVKRPVSFLGNANVFGVFTVLCYIIFFFDNPYYVNKKLKAFLFIITIINVILFAKSRTSLLAFLIVNFIYLVKLRKFKILILLLVIILTLVAFVFINYEKYSILNDIFRLSELYENDDNSYTIRQRIAEFTVNIIKERPFFGVGAGNEQLLMLDLHAPHKGSESASLLILVERGILGYIIYLGIISFQFLLVRNRTKILIGFVILSVDLTETVCVLPQLTSFLAIYLAVSINEKFKNIKNLNNAV